MICLVLGTTEGKEILSRINDLTEDIVVSTATEYGTKLLEGSKVKHFNSKPLDKDGFVSLINKFGIKTLVDVSHPYAVEVSKNLMDACLETNIKYIRFERSSYLDKAKAEDIVFFDKYEELKDIAKGIDGAILNTTGSNNALLINNLVIKNRVIHRVLPMAKILEKLIDGGIKLENIIAMKGPFGYAINDGIIKELNIKAIITKDSGKEGGIEEKIAAALANGCKILMKRRCHIQYGIEFSIIDDLVQYLKIQLN